MEVVLLASTLNTLFPKLWEMRKEAKTRMITIDENLGGIRRGIGRLVDALEAAKFKGAKMTALRREAIEVSQETGDCIQRFFKNKKADSQRFESNTKFYKEAIADLCTRLEKLSLEVMALEKPEDILVDNPTGMDGSRDELLELVKLPAGSRVISLVGFPGLGKTVLAKMVYDRFQDCTLRARVTAAAKKSEEVLRDILKQLDTAGKDESLNSAKEPAADNLHELCKRLKECVESKSVTAADDTGEELIKEILKQLDTAGKDENPKLEKPQADTPVKYENLKLDDLSERLQERLLKKRYLIVIDDIRSEDQWVGMNGAFPKNGDGNGTIIVTTTIQPVANLCSSCNGYVYKLSPLDKNQSLDLFMKDRVWDRDLTVRNASDILKKCEGLPLAIVSMSQNLQALGGPTSPPCAGLGTGLVEGGPGLTRLQWVLMNKYIGLDGDDLRSCLLYFSMYKHDMGAVPERNSLIRRWEAEGFLVPKDPEYGPTDVGNQNMKTLVDHNIIQPMEVGINGVARKCRPPGMMMEYICKISMSENFAGLVSDAVSMPKSRIRRLSFHTGSEADDDKISAMDLSIVRTLAVFGTGSKAILEFEMYDLIEVLDLKKCENLEDKHVEDICTLLLFLKYLSLGDSIGKIPRKIQHLELLETLEMRTEETVFVYKEVLELPRLKHLHGNYMLMDNPNGDLYKFLETKSVLEMTTGFVTETTGGFPDLMSHMRRLRKVKIQCTGNASSKDLGGLPAAIKAFTAEGTNMGGKRSLSIDLRGSPGDREGLPVPLEFLKAEGSVGSLKLRGDCRPLGERDTPYVTNSIPDFKNISGIKKLCLSRTCLGGDDTLDRLKSLFALEFLKLDEELLGPLEIKPDTLKSLTRLCLVGEIGLFGITIRPEALPSLISLHLICKVLQPGLQSLIGNGRVGSLKEIALHSEVETNTKEAWQTAAKGHPNIPAVLLLPPKAQ